MMGILLFIVSPCLPKVKTQYFVHCVIFYVPSNISTEESSIRMPDRVM